MVVYELRAEAELRQRRSLQRSCYNMSRKPEGKGACGNIPDNVNVLCCFFFVEFFFFS